MFAYFDAQPDRPEKLRAFIATCRNADGGYGVRPKTPSSLHGTYYATIVRHWLDGGAFFAVRSTALRWWICVGGRRSKKVGPYTWIREVAGRMKKSDLTAFDPGSFVAWIQGESGKSQPTAIAGRRDLLFKALDVAAAISADTRFEPLVQNWLDTTIATAEQLKTRPRPGLLTIHKLYNEGVILRTPDVCLGIDLYLSPSDSSVGGAGFCGPARRLAGVPFAWRPPAGRSHTDTSVRWANPW